MENLAYKKELYQAVKYQYHEYKNAHGLSMVELWKICTGQYKAFWTSCESYKNMWLQMVLEDYRYECQ